MCAGSAELGSLEFCQAQAMCMPQAAGQPLADLLVCAVLPSQWTRLEGVTFTGPGTVQAGTPCTGWLGLFLVDFRVGT